MAFDLAKALQDVSKLDTGNRPQLQYIHIDQLGSDPNNFYELDGIESLAANIELVGLQQPIRVRQSGADGYIIVSGHRRCAAIRLLVEDGKDFAQVPCLVDDTAESPEMQELRLIYGNSDTRKLSSADLAKQAERVEELLYKLKDQGVEFPGRMRDHVAQACQVSASKLARLKVIREKLAPPLLKLFEAGRIGESVAYAFAQEDRKRQESIHEWWHDDRICEMPLDFVLRLTKQKPYVDGGKALPSGELAAKPTERVPHQRSATDLQLPLPSPPSADGTSPRGGGKEEADDRKGRPYDIIDGAVPSPPPAGGTSPRGGGKEEADDQRSPLRSVEDWRAIHESPLRKGDKA